ncbi:MAG: lipopolysaccharide assembly protein LapA domain-containing protein [Bacteroidales bacterium]|jgi:uncharacterized integral membrane protein|nr:lipopolysaccharide assembly protein LapA domain-containing protein [Bacteroidales bacterium]
MQRRDIIIVIILSLLVVIFATQNAEVVNVQLWIVKFKSSLSLIIIASLIIGALISWLFILKELRKRKKAIVEKNSIIKKLKEEQASKDPFNIDI